MQLSSLPAEIGQLTRLRVLFAYRNRLTEVPEELGACTQLEVLQILLRVLILQIPLLLLTPETVRHTTDRLYSNESKDVVLNYYRRFLHANRGQHTCSYC